MKKLFGSVLIMSMLLSACSTAPITEPKASSVQGLLKPNSVACVQLPTKLKRTSVGFDVNSHSLIGLAFVVASAATMEAQSATWSKAYADYLQSHPDALPLENVFNNELQKDLLAHGVAMQPVSMVKRVTDDKKTDYSVTTSASSVKNTIIIDNLVSIYRAPSSLDGYNPESGVLVAEVPNNSGFVTPTKQDFVNVRESGTTGQYYFASFGAIKADPERAYLGLQRSVTALADRVANLLLALNSN